MFLYSIKAVSQQYLDVVYKTLFLDIYFSKTMWGKLLIPGFVLCVADPLSPNSYKTWT